MNTRSGMGTLSPHADCDALAYNAHMSQTETTVPAAEEQAETQATAKALPEDLPGQIEAALLAVDRPMPTAKLSELIGKAGARAIQQAIDKLNAAYEETGRSFRIEQLAGGWQIMTLPMYAGILQAIASNRQQARLSAAAMETLAIIAYKQPILRAEIEAIRGVACGEVLRSLMERHLVKIVGRAEELGRPMLYGTTKAFLEVFGLANLKDLPRIEEFMGKKVAAE